MKIAVITCYDQNDHIRARVLRKGFADVPGVEVVLVKNRHKGLLRYVEVPCKLLITRLRHTPDVYVITFRGYEMLPVTLLIKGKKPLVFDEMINAAEYLYEHGKLRKGTFADRMFNRFYSGLLRRCRFILSDTQAHAELSASLSGIDKSKYVAVPVGTEEALFYPDPKAKPNQPGKFEVFYYGVMTKLHGLEHVLEAAVRLGKTHPNIVFRLGGDKDKSTELYEAAMARGANIIYQPWFEYKQELPRLIRGANLCLGGPFGDSAQAQFVITTKTFQYMASGAPALIGRNKVNADFIDKKNALVVPQGNAQAIADAVVWAYEHPKELAAVAKAGQRLYEQAFSDSVIAHKLGAIVEAL